MNLPKNLYVCWSETHYRKYCKEKEEQHAKALEACLKCGYRLGPAVWEGSAMIQTTQHLEPKTTGRRKARDLQQPAGVFRYSTCVLESGHAVTDLLLHPMGPGLQDLRTRQLCEHSENLQAWTGVSSE